MREPRTTLHRPVAALKRLQDLVGKAKSAMGDRNENRAAQMESILAEMFDIILAARCGGPLPQPRDHSKVH